MENSLFNHVIEHPLQYDFKIGLRKLITFLRNTRRGPFDATNPQSTAIRNTDINFYPLITVSLQERRKFPSNQNSQGGATLHLNLTNKITQTKNVGPDLDIGVTCTIS